MQLLTIKEAAEACPLPTKPRTIRKWIDHGLRGIRLRSALVGGRRVVPVDALLEFLAAIAGENSRPVLAEARDRVARNQLKRMGMRL